MASELLRIRKCGSGTTNSASSHSIRSTEDYSSFFVDELVGKNQETGRYQTPDPSRNRIVGDLRCLGGFHLKSRPPADSVISDSVRCDKTRREQLARDSPAFRSFFSCGVARQSLPDLGVRRSAVRLIKVI